MEDRYCEMMLAGAVEPDKHHEVRKDHRGLLRRVRHHGSPDHVILMFIWKARKAYLEGDYEEASRDMGRALHYIQDRSVAKGWRGRAHDRREAAVAARPVPVRAITIGMEGAVSSPWFVRDCVQATKERGEPDRIIFPSLHDVGGGGQGHSLRLSTAPRSGGDPAPGPVELSIDILAFRRGTVHRSCSSGDVHRSPSHLCRSPRPSGPDRSASGIDGWSDCLTGTAGVPRHRRAIIPGHDMNDLKGHGKRRPTIDVRLLGRETGQNAPFP